MVSKREAEVKILEVRKLFCLRRTYRVVPGSQMVVVPSIVVSPQDSASGGRVKGIVFSVRDILVMLLPLRALTVTINVATTFVTILEYMLITSALPIMRQSAEQVNSVEDVFIATFEELINSSWVVVAAIRKCQCNSMIASVKAYTA